MLTYQRRNLPPPTRSCASQRQLAASPVPFASVPQAARLIKNRERRRSIPNQQRVFAATLERFSLGRVVLPDVPHCVIGEQPMLPLLALTYTAARLGFEAQSAATFRLLRLGAGITKAAEQTVPEASVPLADIAPAPVATAPNGGTPRRRFTKNRHRLANAASEAKRG
jgi:hypothetical protein